MHQYKTRRRLTGVALVALAGLLVAAPAASADVSQQKTVVSWHAQQAALGKTGQVEGGQASLVRNDNGITYRLSTTGLEPGNAYTLWLAVVNNPAACATQPCSAADIILNGDTRSQVRYAAGNVAGGSGKGTFAGHIRVGSLSGWLPDRALEDPFGSEIHLVINDHGPMLPEFMPGMIQTYRGGCSDSSPFPGLFPATALSDGSVGPNICRLYQAAIFAGQ